MACFSNSPQLKRARKVFEKFNPLLVHKSKKIKKMDTIRIDSIEAVKEAYEKLQVSPKRIEGLFSKFASMPDEFTVIGINASEIVIGTETRIVPEFVVKTKEGTEVRVAIGQMFASYNKGAKASQIQKKDSPYRLKWLVSNNKRVNSFAEGLSEAEFVLFCQGKTFKAANAKDYPVYSGFKTAENGTSVLTFHENEEEAIAAIQPKSYRAVSVIE